MTSLATIIGRNFGVEVEAPAADAAAVSLIGLLFFCIACFVIAGLFLKSSRSKRTFVGEAYKVEPCRQTPESAPWERADDWWKE